MSQSPATIYSERLDARRATAEESERQLDRVGNLRIGVFISAAVAAALSFSQELFHPAWLLLGLPPFVLLVIRSAKYRSRLGRARRAVRFYEDGLARVNGRWRGHGATGERFRSPDHLFADDLDLFGNGSLFERLCSARTAGGESELAGWLADPPSSVADIRQRQEAVGELRSRVDLREQIALLGGEVPPVDFGRLAEWGEQPPGLVAPKSRVALLILGPLNVLLLIVGLATDLTLLPFTVTLLISCGVALPLGGRVSAVLKPVEPMGEQLGLLVGLLARLERERFTSPMLAEMSEGLRVEGEPPSRRIAKLFDRIDWLNARRNQVFLPFALMTFWSTQMAFVLERWRLENGPTIRRWLRAIATFEALGSLAGYAFENPNDPFAEFTESDALEAIGLGHPLLPEGECVRNDVRVGGVTRLLMVSGSNMSGKSTLLRAIGINAALAQAGGPVRAKSLTMSRVSLGATLRIQDSLAEGRSRFFAEITRLRAILDRARDKGSPEVLFLLDELFAGTNSHDRAIGAEGLLRHLLDAGAIGLVTTHDLALTQAADRLADAATNVHFAEEFTDGRPEFDYRIRPGVLPQGNGLALMRAVGLEV